MGFLFFEILKGADFYCSRQSLGWHDGKAGAAERQ